MDSIELSLILDCFGDQITNKSTKTYTIWLEMIARVLNMPIELKCNNYYSKMFKRVKYKLSNSTFWVVIRHINAYRLKLILSNCILTEFVLTFFSSSFQYNLISCPLIKHCLLCLIFLALWGCVSPIFAFICPSPSFSTPSPEFSSFFTWKKSRKPSHNQQMDHQPKLK